MSSAASFYCTEHGTNQMHNTDKCYTLKNRAAKANGSSASSSARFTGKKFCKEIHALYKNSPKKKVLDMFATVLKKEAASLNKQKKAATQKKRQQEADMESDSDSDISVNLLEDFPRCSKKCAWRAGARRVRPKKRTSRTKPVHSVESDGSATDNPMDSTENAEEKTFQAHITALGCASSDDDPTVYSSDEQSA